MVVAGLGMAYGMAYGMESPEKTCFHHGCAGQKGCRGLAGVLWIAGQTRNDRQKSKGVSTMN